MTTIEIADNRTMRPNVPYTHPYSFGSFCIYQQGINRDGDLVSMTCVVDRQASTRPTGSLVNCIHSNLSDASYLRAA